MYIVNHLINAMTKKLKQTHWIELNLLTKLNYNLITSIKTSLEI